MVLASYCRFRKTADTTRSFLDQRIEDLTLSGNLTVMSVVSNLEKQEEFRMINQRLSNKFGTKYGDSVTRSTVIDTSTGEIRTWTKREMSKIQTCNICNHFYLVQMAHLFVLHR